MLKKAILKFEFEIMKDLKKRARRMEVTQHVKFHINRFAFVPFLLNSICSDVFIGEPEHRPIFRAYIMDVLGFFLLRKQNKREAKWIKDL